MKPVKDLIKEFMEVNSMGMVSMVEEDYELDLVISEQLVNEMLSKFVAELNLYLSKNSQATWRLELLDYSRAKKDGKLCTELRFRII